MATYRPNVAVILRKPKNGKVLVFQRKDHRRCWQFPQGGVDKGEDLIGALYREVAEETGISPDLYQIIACRTDYRYKFPDGHLKKGQFCGQTQTYFLCDYYGTKQDINLKAHVQEFVDFKWIKPHNFDLGGVPKFKRKVFRRVFKDFFGIKRLKDSDTRERS